MITVNSQASFSYQYVDIEEIFELRNYFSKIIETDSINIENEAVSRLRQKLFEFFDTADFKRLYVEISRKVAEQTGVELNELVIQQIPTPRVFKPATVGTSYHSDYWYGHGVESKTVWIPLTEIDQENTFYVCPKSDQAKIYDHLKSGLVAPERVGELINTRVPVMPTPGQAFVFGANVLHGSPRNRSNRTRISIDFRISRSQDPSSTKDLQHYYHFKDAGFSVPKHIFEGKRILKYVCGGAGKSTFMQHLIMEASARHYKIAAFEQEAEIERYGFPVLSSYVKGAAEELGIDGILIASHTILDEAMIKIAKATSVPIWCALENCLLSNVNFERHK